MKSTLFFRSLKAMKNGKRSANTCTNPISLLTKAMKNGKRSANTLILLTNEGNEEWEREC